MERLETASSFESDTDRSVIISKNGQKLNMQIGQELVVISLGTDGSIANDF